MSDNVVRTIGGSGVADAIFNGDGSTIYVATGSTITAYAVATGASQGSWTVASAIGGIALTPDGGHLLAADRDGLLDPGGQGGSYTLSQRIYSIDTKSGATTTYVDHAAQAYAGFFDVAALTNSLLLVSGSSFQDAPLRTLDLTTGTFTRVDALPNRVPVLDSSASGLSTIAYARNPDNGSFDLFAFNTAGAVTASLRGASAVSDAGIPYGNNTGLVAVSDTAGLVAVGPKIFNASLQPVVNLTAAHPELTGIVGAAFNATGSTLYLLDNASFNVLAFSTSNWSLLGSYSVGYFSDQYTPDGATNLGAHGDRLSISPDGHTLSVVTNTGVRLLDTTTTTGNTGTSGNDDLTATDHYQSVYGLAGNDILRSGSYTSTKLIGGPGDDTYYAKDISVTIVEQPGEGIDSVFINTATSGGGFSYYKLPDNVENGTLVQSGDGWIAGTDADNRLTTANGNDVLYGLGGNDILEARGGNDQIDGGDGNDIAVIASTRAATTISIDQNGHIILSGPDGTDTLTSIETIRFTDQDVAGSDYVMTGTAGADTLVGNAANNALLGLDGDDTLTGGAGDDLIDGGNGSDTAVFGVARAAATITVNYDGTLTVTSSEGTDQLRNVETLRFSDTSISVVNLRIDGTNGADILNGTPDADAIFGLAGNDTLRGLDGNDLLIGGEGNDLLDGGPGSDVAAVPFYRGQVVVRPGADGDILVGSGGEVDTLRNIERVQFLDAQVAITDLMRLGTTAPDALAASADYQYLYGNDGNDVLRTGSFNVARLDGGAGDDTLISGPGHAAKLTGGAGADTFEGTIAGLAGATITDFTASDRIHVTDASIETLLPVLRGSTLYLDANRAIDLGDNFRFPPPQPLFVSQAADGGIDIRLRPAHMAENDFNGDGRSDILWRSDAGRLSDWLGQDSGGFSGNDANAMSSVTTDWHVVGTADFDGDGRSDLLWRNDAGQLSDWLGLANGGFTGNDANAFRTVSTDWRVAGTGDFNGDGRGDILWRSDSGQMSDWLGQANGGFVGNDANAFVTVSRDWHIAGTGDFNGDGRADILWRSDSGQMSDWLGQANGSFSGNDANALTTVATNWHIAGTGDFNGDGRTDILWRSDAGQWSDWLGQANGAFVGNDANAFATVSADWRVVEIGDYNGDGRDDILWRSDSGQLSNWLGLANGGFVGNDANAFTTVSTDWHTQPMLGFLL